MKSCKKATMMRFAVLSTAPGVSSSALPDTGAGRRGVFYDGGTAAAPVTYAAAGKQAPVFTGGKKISGCVEEQDVRITGYFYGD